jgi:lysophospholipase L1-like esterase
MLLAAKLALGPLLIRQAGVVRCTALRLPEAAGPREGVAGEGVPVMRVLVVGDSSAAGVGIPTQDQALAQPLARALADRLQGAVAWQLVAQSGLDTPGARALLARTQVAPAQVAVTVLGVNDVTAQRSAGSFVTHQAQLWSDLRERCAARWGVVCGLPPMDRLTAMPQPLRWYLGRYASGLDAAVREWSRREDLGYCGLRWTDDPRFLASDGFHPGPALYPEWAQRLADLIAAQRQRWATAA